MRCCSSARETRSGMGDRRSVAVPLALSVAEQSLLVHGDSWLECPKEETDEEEEFENRAFHGGGGREDRFTGIHVASPGSGEGMLLPLFESPQSFVSNGGWRNEACAGYSSETHWGIDGTRSNVHVCRTIIPGLRRIKLYPIGDGGHSGTTNARGRRNIRRQVRGMFVSEGVTVHVRFPFLLLKDIHGTEEGVGKGRANGWARAGADAKRRSLAERLRYPDDLRMDDTHRSRGTSTNWGHNHGNVVKKSLRLFAPVKYECL